jgi:integrase
MPLSGRGVPLTQDTLADRNNYATMIYVAIFTGLRVSELAGLKWNDLHVTEPEDVDGKTRISHAVSIDERYCRGDWGAPKSEASNATIGINACVYHRIQRLRLLTIDVRAGNAVRRYKVVKSDGPDDLVFQSVRTGAPMRDNNILSRHIKPAARKMGLDLLRLLLFGPQIVDQGSFVAYLFSSWPGILLRLIYNPCTIPILNEHPRRRVEDVCRALWAARC